MPDTTAIEKYVELTEAQKEALHNLSNAELDLLLNHLVESIGELKLTLHIKRVRCDMVKWEMHKRAIQ